jgi:hypothetical protein
LNQTDATTRQILEWLEWNHHYARRHNQIPVRGRKLPEENLGIGDIVGCTQDGRYFEIEVKTDRDRLSEAQKKHSMVVLKHRGAYIVAKTFDDFLKQSNQLEE